MWAGTRAGAGVQRVAVEEHHGAHRRRSAQRCHGDDRCAAGMTDQHGPVQVQRGDEVQQLGRLMLRGEGGDPLAVAPAVQIQREPGGPLLPAGGRCTARCRRTQ